MSFTLNEALTQLRRSLGDTDVVNAQWSSEDLEQHLQHALEALSLVLPRQIKSTLTTTAGSRDIDISSLQHRIGIEAVEYPTGIYPPAYVAYSTWGDTLTLLTDAAPAGSESVAIYWRALHTIDPSGATLPSWAERLIVEGAAGYAALEWASHATNRINVGGDQTWEHYLEWGKQRLTAFHEALAAQQRRGGVRVHALFSPANAKPSQTTDWGP